MSENQQNKIKVVDIFHGKRVSENSEKSAILDKFGFEKGIILNAISPNYVKTNTKEIEKNNEREKDKRNSILFREQCEYCLTRFSVSGHLILTKESLLFEPDLRDQNVIINGYGAYQIFIDLYDIYECAHIVVPTKGTYLCINEDPCGFVQVLLKNKYEKEVIETNVKKTNQENETNKNKGVSYYKYISKSLSFMYNLAHPLVQSSSSKEETNRESDHAPFESDSVKSSKETPIVNDQRTRKLLELNKINKNESLEIVGKKDDGICNSDSFDRKSNILKFPINGNENSNNNMSPVSGNKNSGNKNSDNKNGEIPNNSDLERPPKKYSLLDFNVDDKNNIVKHLKDNDLKIYQRINQTHYSDVAGTLPVITYKNNLNTLNSKSISKESSFSEIDVNIVEGEGREGREKREEKEGREGEERPNDTVGGNDSNNSNDVNDGKRIERRKAEKTKGGKKNFEKFEKEKLEGNKQETKQETKQESSSSIYAYRNNEESNQCCNEKKNGCFKREKSEVSDSNNLKKEMEMEVEIRTKMEIQASVETMEKNSAAKRKETNSTSKKNEPHKIRNNDKNNDKNNNNNHNNKGTMSMTSTMNMNKKMDNSIDVMKKEKRKNFDSDMEGVTNINKQKAYEEKGFVLFRFFNNARAYETTVKIIKEIDEVRKSGKQMKKTITSVPFTSNELLAHIIEQSLYNREDMDKMQNLKFGDNNSDHSVSSQKSSTNVGFPTGKEQKYQVIEPKLEYINGAMKLINKYMSKQINYYLPPTISIKVWKLAFCTSIHGVSFNTLYRSVKNKGYILLFIYDMNNILFGYFADQLNCDNCYYGSGENFLFTFMTEDDIKQREEKKKQEKDINKNVEIKTVSISSTVVNEKQVSVTSSNTSRCNSEVLPNLHMDSEKKESGSKQTSYSSSTANSNNNNNKNNINNSINNNDNNNNDNDIFAKDTIDKGSKKDYSTSLSNVLNAVGDAIREKAVNVVEQAKEKRKQKLLHIKNKYGEHFVDESFEKRKPIKVYQWTSKNNFFMYSDEKSIMIGGGDSCALIINEDLCKGQTGKSSTYDNDLLTLDEEFEIQCLQLWVFHDY